MTVFQGKRLEQIPENTDAGLDPARIQQQNVQLRHLLNYREEVEIPVLERQVAALKEDLGAQQSKIREKTREEEFLGKRVGILHLDPEERVAWINVFALEVLGITSDQAIGKPIREVGAHFQSGRPVFADIAYFLEPDGRESEWEKEFPMPNGDKRYVRFRSALMGEGVRIISITDVTDLRIWESRVKAIVGTSKDGIALVDESGTIRAINARFGKMFGLNWRQFVGMQFFVAADLLQYHFHSPQDFVDFLSVIQEDPQLQREGLFEMVLPVPASYQVFTRPMVDEQSRLIGRVWFITDVSQFKEMERKLLANARELEDKVRQRTEELSIQNQELMEMRREIERELEMAKQVQDGMMPKSLPVLSQYELAADYVPTGQVGGDFYNIELLDANHLFLMLTDVSGHGVPAALVTAMAKMAFDRHLREKVSVSRVLAGVNLDLCAAIKTEHYLTAFAGILELDTGRLRYCRVGHPYPLLLREKDGSVEMLNASGGFFLGMFPEAVYDEQETELHPGDLLFVYTDGVTEAMNAGEEMYGRGRLEKVIQACGTKSPQEILGAVNADRERFSAGRPTLDDISLFALRRRAAGKI